MLRHAVNTKPGIRATAWVKATLFWTSASGLACARMPHGSTQELMPEIPDHVCATTDFLVAAGPGSEFRVFDAGGELLHRFEHVYPPRSLMILACGNLVYVHCYGDLYLYKDISRSSIFVGINIDGFYPLSFLPPPDGRLCAVGSGGAVQLVDLDEMIATDEAEDPDGPVRAPGYHGIVWRGETIYVKRHVRSVHVIAGGVHAVCNGTPRWLRRNVLLAGDQPSPDSRYVAVCMRTPAQTWSGISGMSSCVDLGVFGLRADRVARVLNTL